MLLTAGTRLGPYEIRSHLGAGGMGDVYKARDARLERFVAIKILRRELTGDPDSRRRFEREARAISALNHPHICTLHDVGRQDELDFLVMELVSGETLATRLASRGALPIEEAVRYGLEIADALAHAHERGVVHRDLKSANVIVTTGGGIKVLDFGVAIRLKGMDAEGPDGQTITGSQATVGDTATVAGTFGYMAPEVLQGSAADARADIWALGVVLYEMVAGARPFRGGTSFEVVSAILRDLPAPLPSGVPGPLQATIHRCLAKDSTQRYRRASEVGAALDTFRGDGAAASRDPARVRPALAPAAVEAERRQVSVLCGDLAGSAALAEPHDPEDLREVLRSYQDACREAIRRFDGQVAQTTGYGLVAYFGYPRAHEDDAQRAVRAGLEMVRAVEAVNHARAATTGAALSVRVGIDTGLVLAEETPATEERGATTAIIGEAPGLATRLQALAGPNSVIVSDRTLRLVQGTFDVEDLGLPHVPGPADQRGPFRILRERRAEDRFDAMHATRLTPLVGRDEELALLLGRWALAQEGEGQVVAFRGEPGIGKSRILRTLRERLDPERSPRVSYQCSPFFTSTAFYPVIAQLQRAAGFADEDTTEAKLEKLDAWLASTGAVAEAGPLLAALLSLEGDGRTSPLKLSPQRQKERTIDVIVAQLTHRARAEALLVVFEDMHWIDPSTAELVDRLVAEVAKSRILLLVTYRPTVEPSWLRYAHVTVHSLSRLSKRHSALMATKVADKALPDALVRHIVDKTDGVPLFVEELTKAVIESTLVTDAGDRYELAGGVDMVRVPATLHDSLMARLDRLIPMKEVAQIGAAIGREFPYRLLAAVSPMGASELQAALDRIVDSELVHRQGSPPDAVYVFKHALVQDAAYDSLLRKRKVALHQRIAQALEHTFPETAETQPELIAEHYTRAERIETAIPYWLKAGARALARSASLEAASHLERGIALVLTRAATTDRDQTELQFQAALGAAYMSAYGWGAEPAGRAYERATALCRRIGITAEHVPILFGDLLYTGVSGDIHGAVEKARQVRELSLTSSDDAIHLLAAWSQQWSSFLNGRCRDSMDRVKEVVQIYVPERHLRFASQTNHDVFVITRVFESLSLWMLGYPDQAIASRIETEQIERRHANEHGLFFQLVFGLSWAATTFVLCRDFVALQERANEGVRIATEMAFATKGLAMAYQGYCLFELGQRDEGFQAFVRGFNDYFGLTAGAGAARPCYLTLYTSMLGRLGRVDEAIEQAQLAEQQIARFGEECWWAEVLRVKGEVLATIPGAKSRAEDCYRRAIAVAQRQQARGWELRAATSLARLLRQQGRHAEARDVLAPVYGWFTEGLQTPDLLDAKNVLDTEA